LFDSIFLYIASACMQMANIYTQRKEGKWTNTW